MPPPTEELFVGHVKIGISSDFVYTDLVRPTCPQISLAIVVDGSSGSSPAEFDLQKSFAQSAVASFAERNLFENGGTASYVQAGDTVASDGTFASQEAFDAFVADDEFSEGSAFNANEGISKAQELLSASPSAAALMIVVTDEDCDP